MRLLPFVLLLQLSMVPAASAAGFYMTDNGTKTLMLGGAFAGQADDLSAMQHNPAGLAQLSGFQFLVDPQLLFHSVTFERRDPKFDPMNPGTTLAQPVSNQGGPFLLPLAGAGYGLKLLDRDLTVAVGIWGPPADGHYAYPEPSYERCTMEQLGMADGCQKSTDLGKYLKSPQKYAPQRYSLVSSTIYILYPTLSVAYAVHPRFSLGVSLQPVIGTFQFGQSVTSITRLFPVPSNKQKDEDPTFDSQVKVNLPWQLLNFTVIGGVMVRPLDWLQLGVSFRPQVMVNARGKLAIEVGEGGRALGTTVQGDEVTLSLMLPAELKVGLHAQLTSRLGVNFDYVYQGWQSVQEFVLDPQNVTMTLGSGEPQKVAPFRIQKHWQSSDQFRLGVQAALFPWLQLYLGGWYETGAIPDQFMAVDFAHFERVYLTGGAGLRLGSFEVLLGAAGSPSMAHAVPDSQVTAGSTEPTPAGVVGTGVYTSSNFIVTLGVRGSFGGWPSMPQLGAPGALEPAAPAPAPAPEPAAAPEPTPAPENASEAPKS